jgi:hypothetical protein
MVHREDPNGVLLITQPAHAWISGQMARLWGNEIFGDFTPRPEVELAAELHDLGFLKWEEEPTLNEGTGLPHTFLSLPVAEHLEIWERGIYATTGYGRYPALLVSMHYTWLAQKHPHYENPQAAMLTQDFLDTQAAYQSFAFASLRRDPHFAAAATEEAFTRNRRLVSLWDWLSLLLCMGKREAEVIREVPIAQGLGELVLRPKADDPWKYTLAPWPFRSASVKLVCEAKLLEKKFQTTHAMQMGIKNAQIVPLEFELNAER